MVKLGELPTIFYLLCLCSTRLDNDAPKGSDKHAQFRSHLHFCILDQPVNLTLILNTLNTRPPKNFTVRFFIKSRETLGSFEFKRINSKFLCTCILTFGIC